MIDAKNKHCIVVDYDDETMQFQYSVINGILLRIKNNKNS